MTTNNNNNSTRIIFVTKHANAVPPVKATEFSAGFDLVAIEPVAILPGKIGKIKTGLGLVIPHGYEGQIRSRSGLASKGVWVANSPGTIDSDYEGELGVLLYNSTDEVFNVNIGDRIAQLVICQLTNIEMACCAENRNAKMPIPYDFVDRKVRGSGGFGSTDVK